MIASAHIAAGFVAGVAGGYATTNRIARIAAAFTLGVVSHVVLDAIPHSDYGALSGLALGVLVSLEFVAVGSIAFYMLRRRLRLHWLENVLAGLFGAVLPDAKFIASVLLSDRFARIVEYYGDRFHDPFHAGPTSLALGIAAEVACTILLLACLYGISGERRGMNK